MGSVYESIMAGLNEAVEDAKSKEKKLPRRTVTVASIIESHVDETKGIRRSIDMSQKTFSGVNVEELTLS